MNTIGGMNFLLTVLFDLAIFLFLTRFLLQLVQADFYNPISQSVVRFTHPVLAPLQRIIPSVGRFNVAALLIIIALLMVKIVTLLSLQGISVGGQVLTLYAVHSAADLLLKYLYWAVIARVVLSWIAPDPRQPFTAIVADITEPLMAPVRRILPSLGGLDFSPIVVLLGLQFVRILLGS